MFKSATFKLTVSYLMVVMVISLVFSLVVFRIGEDNVQISLNRQSQELSTAFPVFNGTPYASPDPNDVRSARQHLIDELLMTNAIVLVGAGLICYILARETLRPIEEAHEKQSRFTADVSHELRTPLTSLKMESEVALLDESLSKQALRQVITSNMEEAQKLETLVNNLLRLTRLEAGELAEAFTPTDLSAVAKLAQEQLSIQARERQIAVINQVKPLTIQGDQDSLTQLVVILLDNAIKYSSNGGEVSLASEIKPHPSLIIRDHGKGIPAEDLYHVFDRFYRSDTARNKGGYGLGLSIAKQIADLHHATITISSEENQGTTVRVEFSA